MKTHDEFVRELKGINPNIQVVGPYTRAVDKIAVKCKVCGLTWSPRAYSLTQGKGCAHCSAVQGAKSNHGKTGLKTQEQFIDKMAHAHPTISVVGKYVNTHTPIECSCSLCSHQWTAMPYSLLQGHGCPRCVKSGTSFMEQFIRLSFVSVLGEDAVLSRDKSAIGMELDVFIPSMNIAIEPGNWYLHQKSLHKDKLKRERCAEKGIILITIYDKFPQDTPVPFADHCYTFVDDLNKADHYTIKKLICDLFADVGLLCVFSEEQWNFIEESAYRNAKAKTHTDFIEEMKRLHPNISVIGQYQNSNKRLRVKCETCCYEWNAVPASLLSGDGCRKCGAKEAHLRFVKGQREFIEQVRIVNPNVEILGEYTGRHSKVRTKCLVCGHVWEPVAASLLRGSSHKGAASMHKKTNSKPK